MSDMKTELKFEAALERIERIVQELESGEVALDVMLEKYEEGARLIKLCLDKLNEAESKIKKLTEDQGTGNFKIEPFEE